MDLVKTTEELFQVRQLLAEEIDRHSTAKKNLLDRIEQLQVQQNQWKEGLDVAKIEAAKMVIRVRGNTGTDRVAPARREIINAALEDLSRGPVRLLKEYLGIKNYSGFGDQHSCHSYGTGPRHGHIVFAIELKERTRPLTHEEKEAAIYYLLNLRKIEEAAKEALNGH